MLKNLKIFISVNFLKFISNDKETIKGSALALIIRTISALIAFLFNLVVTKNLGAIEAGYFFLSLSIATFCSSVARLGFDNTVLRITGIHAKSNTYKFILNYALRWSLALSIIMAFIIFIFADLISYNIFNKPEMELSLRYIVPSIVGFSSVIIIAMSLQARRKYLISIPCQNIAHFVLAIGMILFYSANSSNQVSLYLSLSLGLTASFFYIYSLMVDEELEAEEFDKDEFWKSARPNWFIDLTNSLIQWGSPIIVGIFLISSEVAYFTVSLRTALLTSLIILAINSIMAPKVAKLYKDRKTDEIKKLAFLSIRLCVVASIPVISFMILYADFLMSLFGEEFINSSHILKILIIGQGINLVTGSVGYILLMTGNESDMRFITLVSGSLLIIFLPIFTFVYGLIGAAWVATLCRSVQSLLPVYFINKRLGFNTLLFWK